MIIAVGDQAWSSPEEKLSFRLWSGGSIYEYRFPGGIRLTIFLGLKNKIWIRIKKVKLLTQSILNHFCLMKSSPKGKERLPIYVTDPHLQVGRSFTSFFGKD